MQNAFSLKNLTGTIHYLMYFLTMTPIIISGAFLFPYISIRTIFFRTVLEVILIIALILFWRRRVSVREQLNYFLVVFGLFAIANIISSFFSFSLSIAWFSDIERMWGVFTLLHLFLFYLLLRSFFKGRQWKIFLNISIVVSLYAAAYGIIQHYPEFFNIHLFGSGQGRIISTLGNSAYVAIYMIFNIFFALFLLVKTDNKWLKFFYIASIIINSFAFNLASIRGASLGLLLGLTTAALVYILLGKSRLYKIIVAGVLIIGSSLMFYAFMNPEGRLAGQSSLLHRVSTISLSGSTTETRLIGWRAAWEGFKEHPLLGVGMDNYNVVFNKYFDANYYLYAPGEPYFDRSHNGWLDVLVMNGIIGFIIFLGFPFFIGWYLIKGYREQKIALNEFLIFLTLSLTYFTHLIFVFDDLNSYAYFVVLISFIEYRYYKNTIIEVSAEESQAGPGAAIAPAVFIIMLLAIMYNFNIKVALAANRVIDALTEQSSLEKAFALFDEALSYNSVSSRNIVLSYVNLLAGLGNNLPALLNDNRETISLVQKAFQKAREALDKEIKKDPYNAMLYNRRAVLNNLAYLLSGNNMFIQAALEDSGQAVELSAEHLQYYYTLADSYLIVRQYDKAAEAIKASLKINNQYKPGYFHLMRVYLAKGDLDGALNSGRILARQDYQPDSSAIFTALAQGFLEQNKTAEAAEAYELAARLNEDNINIVSRLIKLYLENQQYEKALLAAEIFKANSKNDSYEINYIIDKIKAGEGAGLLKQIDSSG